ncbi:MAG: hypothetical protein KKA79_03135 [Nanoarchaeota archaeon]|nr:hypothetical protein [Nanoarchaeota archaeon]
MKIPETFRTGKDLTQEDIEEIIKKTLVDKILVEEFGDYLKEYLEKKSIADTMVIKFDKYLNIRDKKYEPIDSIEKVDEENKEIEINLFSKPFFPLETRLICDEIMNQDSGLKDTEVFQKGKEFSIVNKDVIYKGSIDVNGKPKYIREDTREDGFTEVYVSAHVVGEIKYVKFSPEHNSKLIQALRNMDYDVMVDFKEKKK